MIRLSCPKCKSKLNAKEKLVGQTRKCPNCGAPVLITRPGGENQSATRPPVGSAGEAGLLALDVPQRLERTSRYLICDSEKLVACWENNGKGWMLKTNAGLISARRNPEQLPSRGDFKLIELTFTAADAGPRLDGINSYQLATEWALITLGKGDDKVLAKVTGPGHLNTRQKNTVRQTIKDQLMHPVWAGAGKVLEYLASTDYHSPGTTP